MEALIKSRAEDHTVGRKALTAEQFKTRYKIPEQAYNMATGTVIVDKAVDLFVPALATWERPTPHLRRTHMQGGGIQVSVERTRRRRGRRLSRWAGGRYVVEGIVRLRYL